MEKPKRIYFEYSDDYYYNADETDAWLDSISVEKIEDTIDSAWEGVAKSLGSTQSFEKSKFTEDYKDERRLLALAIHKLIRGE
jgi:hypothetical protein